MGDMHFFKDGASATVPILIVPHSPPTPCCFKQERKLQSKSNQSHFSLKIVPGSSQLESEPQQGQGVKVLPACLLCFQPVSFHARPLCCLINKSQTPKVSLCVQGVIDIQCDPLWGVLLISGGFACFFLNGQPVLCSAVILQIGNGKFDSAF